MTQVAPTLHSTRVPTRTVQLRRIHELARQAGFITTGEVGDPRRERYERELTRVIGVPSVRRASRNQREAVIDHFRKMIDAGYRLANARPVVPVSDEEAGAFL